MTETDDGFLRKRTGRNMPKAITKAFTVAAMAAATLAASTSPAVAAAGGGCTSHASAASCISYSANYVKPDFYINRALDSSIHKAAVMLYINGRHITTWWEDPLTHTGHYGPYRFHVDGEDDRSQVAFTRLRVYTRSGSLHFETDSPKVSYWA